MEILYLEKTNKTCELDFNPEMGVLKMSGASISENATEFYQPIYNWLDEYTLHPASETVMVFHLLYYNTAQSYYIVKLFRKLEALNNKDKGHKVSVKWCYDEDDEDMKEAGKDFKSLFSLEMELVMLPY